MWAVTPPPEQELERLWRRLSVVDDGTVVVEMVAVLRATYIIICRQAPGF